MHLFKITSGGGGIIYLLFIYGKLGKLRYALEYLMYILCRIDAILNNYFRFAGAVAIGEVIIK
jgi:hypothetical protein